MAVFVVFSHPADEVENISIAPHPREKSLKTAERVYSVFIATFKTHVLVHAICIRPIRLDSNGVEAFFRNQAFGDLRTNPIELMGAVAGFSDQKESRIAGCLNQRVKIGCVACQRVRRPANCINYLVLAFG